MGTLQAEIGEKRDMDDSGCVEDESTSTEKCPENGCWTGAQLLDLSDDVLLCILKYCSPLDLKALGYACPRLGTLIRDRTLWQTVDARDQPCGRSRLRWMLEHCLHAGTKELLLSGHAKQAEGCQGLVNRTRQEVNEAEKIEQELNQSDASESSDATSAEGECSRQLTPPYPLYRQHARLHINAHPLPRFNTSPVWPEELSELSDKLTSSDCEASTACPGPQFTLTQGFLKQLQVQCSELSSLALDYCNINCDTTGINRFPPKLKKLSLRGTKCYNLHNQSFLFKIQDYLPLLEELDVSECSWLEPCALLPLSKLPGLTRLHLRDCPRMAEFVAYCSLAARYGFPSLQMVDLRGSPVADSEVSGLGWVRSLRELHVSAPPPPRRVPAHAHCRGDALPAFSELQPWELQVPEYFQSKTNTIEGDASDTTCESLDDQLDQTRAADGSVGVNAPRYELRPEGDRYRIVERPREIRRIDGHGDDSRSSDGMAEIKDHITEMIRSRCRSAQMGTRLREEAIGDTRPMDRYQTVLRIRNIDSRPMHPIGRIGDILYDLPERGLITIRNRVKERESGDSAEVNGNALGPSSKRSRPDDEKPSQSSCITGSSTLTNRNESGPSPKKPRPDDENPTQSQYVTIKRRSDFPINDEKPSQSNFIATSSKNINESGPSPKEPRLDDEKPKTQYVTIKRRSDFPIDDEKPSQSNFIATSSTNIKESSLSPKEPRLDDEKPKTQYVTIKRRSDFENFITASVNGDEAGPSPKEPRTEPRRDDEKPKSQYVTIKRGSDFNIDDEVKKICQRNVNEGASTSKNYSADGAEGPSNNQSGTKNCDEMDVSKEQLDSNVSNASDCDDDVSNCSKANNRGSSPSNSVDSVESNDRQRRVIVERYIRFQEHQDPLAVELSVAPRQNQEQENPQENNENPQGNNENPPENQDAEPRHRVVYLNVGHQHSILRVVPNRPAVQEVRNHRNFRDCFRNFCLVPPTQPNVDASLLVSDLAVSSFGRAAGDNVNYIHIGPNGVAPAGAATGMRPNISNLRVLSMVGFRNITDRSLVHLATAAPHLELIDFSRTNVTERGVENFKSLRPDCQVIYSPFDPSPPPPTKT